MAADIDLYYIRLALEQARRSPPKPTNYCVGAVLVDRAAGKILSTGYTLELPGNTHAEQCCLSKYAELHGVSEDRVGSVLPDDCVIYTTMEPCSERLSGNLPCTDRIIATTKAQSGKGIRAVFSGVSEPDTLVQQNVGRHKIESAGIKFVHVPGCEQEILQVATSGHNKPNSGS